MISIPNQRYNSFLSGLETLENRSSNAMFWVWVNSEYYSPAPEFQPSGHWASIYGMKMWRDMYSELTSRLII